MIDHSRNSLRAAITCLRETVAPALDPSDPQAAEQLKLTIDFLEFLRERVHDVHARHRYELACQIAMGEQVRADARAVSSRAGTAIEGALDAARAVHVDPGAHTEDLRAAGARLWAAMRSLVRTSREADADVRDRIETAVVRGTEPLIALERAWYLPFGFDPQPEGVPTVDEALRAREHFRVS